MFPRTRVVYSWMCAFVLPAMLGSAALAAFTGQPRSANGSGEAALTMEVVKTGLYLISGGGGNSLLRLSANGLIIVDGKRQGNYKALMSQVRRVSKFSDLPVRFLILTDHHEQNAGNTAQFVAAGARIVAHANVTHNLKASNPAEPAAPSTTYDRDQTLRLGGIEVRLMHFGDAHTNGDTVVYFPNLKVVALGDLFAATPDPDFSAGGCLTNWGSVLSDILKLDFDIAVPGTGPVIARADVEAFRNKVDTLVSRATALRKQGVAKHDLMAQLDTRDLGWRLTFEGDRLDHFYAELARTR